MTVEQIEECRWLLAGLQMKASKEGAAILYRAFVHISGSFDPPKTRNCHTCNALIGLDAYWCEKCDKLRNKNDRPNSAITY